MRKSTKVINKIHPRSRKFWAVLRSINWPWSMVRDNMVLLNQQVWELLGIQWNRHEWSNDCCVKWLTFIDIDVFFSKWLVPINAWHTRIPSDIAIVGGWGMANGALCLQVFFFQKCGIPGYTSLSYFIWNINSLRTTTIENQSWREPVANLIKIAHIILDGENMICWDWSDETCSSKPNREKRGHATFAERHVCVAALCSICQCRCSIHLLQSRREGGWYVQNILSGVLNISKLQNCHTILVSEQNNTMARALTHTHIRFLRSGVVVW